MASFNRTSGKGGSLLDNGVAAIAALSGGFVVYAMPDGLFSRLIVKSGLPQFLAAAQPPLGMKARLAVVAVAALLVYALAWSVMRALDSIGGSARSPFDRASDEEAPRLRRADAHPDAPSRRPILAGRDLGEPAFDDEPLELEPETAAAFDPEPYSPMDPELDRAEDPEPYPMAEPEPHFAAEPEAHWSPEPVHELSEPLPAFLVPQEPEEEQEAAVLRSAPSFEEPAEESREIAPHSFDSHYEETDEEGDGEEGDEGYESDDDSASLTRLMHRFESGLGRKQQALEAAPPPASEPEPGLEEEALPQERVRHRLRNAISDLNRMSAPGR